ncbi:hypothetical protein [Candidatus Nitrosocosmicus sp. R]
MKLYVLVMMIVVLGSWVHQALAQQEQWKTYYNPEKQFSIDYLPDANITEKDNRVGIDTNSTLISVNINPETKSAKESAVLVQNGFQKDGEGIWETTHPVVIDDVVGYSFTLNNTDPTNEIVGNDLLSTFTYSPHNGKIYQFMINENMMNAYYNPEQKSHIIDSIKFFD